MLVQIPVWEGRGERVIRLECHPLTTRYPFSPQLTALNPLPCPSLSFFTFQAWRIRGIDYAKQVLWKHAFPYTDELLSGLSLRSRFLLSEKEKKKKYFQLEKKKEMSPAEKERWIKALLPRPWRRRGPGENAGVGTDSSVWIFTHDDKSKESWSCTSDDKMRPAWRGRIQAGRPWPPGRTGKPLTPQPHTAQGKQLIFLANAATTKVLLMFFLIFTLVVVQSAFFNYKEGSSVKKLNQEIYIKEIENKTKKGKKEKGVTEL